MPYGDTRASTLDREGDGDSARWPVLFDTALGEMEMERLSFERGFRKSPGLVSIASYDTPGDPAALAHDVPDATSDEEVFATGVRKDLDGGDGAFSRVHDQAVDDADAVLIMDYRDIERTRAEDVFEIGRVDDDLMTVVADDAPRRRSCQDVDAGLQPARRPVHRSGPR